MGAGSSMRGFGNPVAQRMGQGIGSFAMQPGRGGKGGSPNPTPPQQMPFGAQPPSFMAQPPAPGAMQMAQHQDIQQSMAPAGPNTTDPYDGMRGFGVMQPGTFTGTFPGPMNQIGDMSFAQPAQPMQPPMGAMQMAQHQFQQMMQPAPSPSDAFGGQPNFGAMAGTLVNDGFAETRMAQIGQTPAATRNFGGSPFGNSVSNNANLFNLRLAQQNNGGQPMQSPYQRPVFNPRQYGGKGGGGLYSMMQRFGR